MEIGQKIRYRKLGPGQIIDLTVRPFFGQQRQFAVIDFPQRQMTAHLPVGDPTVAANIGPLLTADEFDKLLSELNTISKLCLERNWEQRQELGQEILAEAQPADLVQLLSAYARAQGAGVTIPSADRAVIVAAQELLAAELFLLSEQIDELTLAQEEISQKYTTAVNHFAASGLRADNFWALSQVEVSAEHSEIEAEAQLRPQQA